MVLAIEHFRHGRNFEVLPWVHGFIMRVDGSVLVDMPCIIVKVVEDISEIEEGLRNREPECGCILSSPYQNAALVPRRLFLFVHRSFGCWAWLYADRCDVFVACQGGSVRDLVSSFHCRTALSS